MVVCGLGDVGDQEEDVILGKNLDILGGQQKICFLG